MEEEVAKACAVLRKGGVIVYPTDTIWGIGCDATNEAAVQKVYEIKRRSDTKSMLVLLDSADKIGVYVDEVPEIAEKLVEVAEKPLTIIYSGARNLAANLVAEDGSIGIRITREAFSQRLCRKFGRPVVSTSANFSGEPSPQNFSEINSEILRLSDYTVDYRHDEKQKSAPSSIIRLDGKGNVKIIRE
ncbi:MAG: threonylcarbamoyl-AMP synthase [Dysgonamonadaceae bacterium]|jgi:L-threonylcarbamoyladenylate synthase|nr:threonylcarbamoyl-AMP synthase [Dysgonamonadaceae bacterium]